jgi:hypothetical protein
MRPLISSFLLGESTQLQKGNLSASERGLSANVTKFVFCRFSCHIADCPCQGVRISAALCSSPRVYAAPQAANSKRTVSHPRALAPLTSLRLPARGAHRLGCGRRLRRSGTGCAGEGLLQHTDPRGSRWVWASVAALRARAACCARD